MSTEYIYEPRLETIFFKKTRLETAILCKIYTLKRQNYVQRYVTVRFIKSAIFKLIMVMWHSGRRSNNFAGGQLFEVSAERSKHSLFKINSKLNVKLI